MKKKNVVYSESPWPFIFPIILLYLGLVIVGIYFKGKELNNISFFLLPKMRDLYTLNTLEL